MVLKFFYINNQLAQQVKLRLFYADCNPHFVIPIYSLHHRWKVPWATPSAFAAALPLISPRFQAAITSS